LFGHTNSQKIIALAFRFGKEKLLSIIIFQDGSVTEIHGLSLLFTAPRGIALMREERPPRGRKNEDKGAYYQKTLRLPKPPKFLILDSKGYIRVFSYYDTRYASQHSQCTSALFPFKSSIKIRCY